MLNIMWMSMLMLILIFTWTVILSVDVDAHIVIHFSLMNLINTMPSRLIEPDFVPSTLQQVQELVDADRCSLFLVDPTTGKLWAKDANTGEEISMSLDRGIMGYASRSGRVVNVPDVAADGKLDFHHLVFLCSYVAMFQSCHFMSCHLHYLVTSRSFRWWCRSQDRLSYPIPSCCSYPR